jgi:hypothetical protein
MMAKKLTDAFVIGTQGFLQCLNVYPDIKFTMEVKRKYLGFPGGQKIKRWLAVAYGTSIQVTQAHVPLHSHEV